jgi:UDP-N-acetylmuramoyl-L-alanyl-D-glutamate--2,6-diaminopimelate ligase
VLAGTRVDPSFAHLCVEVDDVRRAMADVAQKFYEYPGKKLKLFGITGTKGKTSTAYLLESIFRAAGQRTAILGTVECRHPGRSYPSHHTTREAIDLQQFLAECVAQRVESVVLEVSSHALSLDRVRGCEFEGVIFTNLSPDHMDFYKTMEPYFSAKKLLFQAPYRKSSTVAVVNADDDYGQRLEKEAAGHWVSFGKERGALRIQAAAVEERGAWIDLHTPSGEVARLQSQIPGEFTFANIAAAAALALGVGIPVAQVQKGIQALPGVPGRLERVPTKLPFSVFVDFAHSGHALDNVLTALRSVCRGKLIVVFGAGGDKDPARRTTQGKVAAEKADFSVITSDNPRSEDPLKIIAAIEASFRASGGKHLIVEPDRRLAIRRALVMAAAGDVICLAGKGHETGQIIGTEVVPFDDREEAGLVLRELESALSRN